MSFYKNIKSDALLILKNNYLKTILITAIIGLVFLMGFCIETLIYSLTDINNNEIINIINSCFLGSKMEISMSESLQIFLIISIIICLIFCSILSVLKMGYVHWNYLTIFKQSNSFLNIFSYFSCFKDVIKSMYISLQIFMRKIIWSIVIFLPAILTGIWSILATMHQNQVTNKYLISFGYILTFCLIIAGLITRLIFFQRYVLTRYLIISDEILQDDGQDNLKKKLKIRKAIKLSIKIMKNNKTDYLFLILSFAIWLLLCLLILPIFFVLPYINISLTLYSRYLVEKYNQEKTQCL